MSSRTFGVAAALAVAVLTIACRPTYVIMPASPQPHARHDTVVVQDTVIRTDTVVTRVAVRPTQARPAPQPAAPTRVDTVIVRDTVRVRDTIVVRQPADRRPAQPVDRRPPPTREPMPGRPPAVVVTEPPVPPAEVVTEPPVHAPAEPRTLNVPPGHHPPAGRCRVWFEGRAPGQQPRHVACDELRGNVPEGAFVIFAGKLWDGDFDWTAFEAANPGAVPLPIQQLKTAPGKVGEEAANEARRAPQAGRPPR